MENDLKQAELEDESTALEHDPEMWDWARAAGVSREDLLRALELSRPR